MAGFPSVVSLVTPSYQQATYLRECVESVLGQTWKAIDYLVVDGGSSDESVDILREFGSRVRWRSQRDGGQAAAISDALKAARGDIVGYVNSDDVLRPNAVASAARFLERHPDIDVVYGRATIMDEQSIPLRPFPSRAFDPDLLVQHCFISQPAAFWRRSLHDRIGYFSTEFDHTLDYEFWIRAMKAGAKFLYVDEEWACAREHGEAKSQRLRGEIFRQIIKLQLRHLGYCGRSWWEQYLRYLRDEKGGVWRMLPGKKDERLHRLAWWPYVLWRRKLGGPLFHRAGHWRA